jgi:hypothetical protein
MSTARSAGGLAANALRLMPQKSVATISPCSANVCYRDQFLAIDQQDMVFYDSARSEVNILNMNKTQFETHRSMSYAVPSPTASTRVSNDPSAVELRLNHKFDGFVLPDRGWS